MRFLTIVTMLLLAACGGPSVVVKGTFPDPLVTPLPLHTGVYFPDKFKTYVLKESKGEGLRASNSSIDIGAAQLSLFQRLFKGYFQDVTYLAALPDSDEFSHLDGIIAPEVVELQYSVPNDTKSKIYEVWIKYQLNLYKADGELISSWPVTGYGKTPTRFMKRRDAALEQAAVVALRDAGAHFAARFDRLATVKQWLETRIAANQIPRTE